MIALQKIPLKNKNSQTWKAYFQITYLKKNLRLEYIN